MIMLKSILKYYFVLFLSIDNHVLAQESSGKFFGDPFLGYKQLEIKLIDPKSGKETILYGHASFSKDIQDKFVRESFSFHYGTQTISGSAYIGYSNAHHRYELIQVDDFSQSMITLNGDWDDSTKGSITFQPITGYPQWGFKDGLNLKWTYIIGGDGNFTKEIWLFDGVQYVLSSSYIYTSNDSNKFVFNSKWKASSVTTKNGMLTYYIIGKGKPVLLINGGPGWSSDHIKPFAEAIADLGYQVIVYDQRGTGKSAITPLDSSTVTFKNMTDDIEILRKKLGITFWTIVGHSFGAMQAMQYAVNYPVSIGKLILLSPGGSNLDFLETYLPSINARLSNENLTNIDIWLAKADKNPGLASYNIISSTLPAFLFKDSLTPTVMQHIDKTTWNMDVSNFVWSDLSRTHFDINSNLSHFDKPVFIIQGRQDALGDAHVNEIKGLFKKASLQFINNCAHILWMDQPDETIRLMKEVLQK